MASLCLIMTSRICLFFQRIRNMEERHEMSASPCLLGNSYSAWALSGTLSRAPPSAEYEANSLPKIENVVEDLAFGRCEGLGVNF
jgi:hypothetical protein